MGSNDVVAITGIAVTFVVSVANLIYSLRTNRRTIFVNTVTTSRLKWIDTLRDEVSEFIAVTTRLADHSLPLDKRTEMLLQRDTLLHQIALHLNPVDPEDQRLKTLAIRARELSEQGDVKKELPAALTELRDATGNYLKKEWNRVKNESEGR
ncbi:MAG TPA: hypothetical protein VMQ56_08275 [Terracidiphilus sp.]|jgi:hypothetical protein|nr:hypothetical protein [Terracidiphilus sp.]